MKEPSTVFVVLMGVIVVFIGLLCIVGILELMHLIVSKVTTKRQGSLTITPIKSDPEPAAPVVIENREEIIAAVSAALAEELGKDLSAIRILSFKKID